MPLTLVIDDDPALEETLTNALQGKAKAAVGGHDFLFARSDAEAINLLKNNAGLDLALVTIDSGQISGLGLFRKLDGTRLRLPRVALTSGRDLAAIRRAMNAGAVDFLTKPISPSDLIATIDKVYADCEIRRKSWRTEAELAAIRRELDIASDLQKRILPRQFPTGDGVELFARMKPAREMGGDFYDFFQVAPDKLGLVVADVSGKGVPAAFFMAVARTLIRATALAGAGPGLCLDRVNRLLCDHDIPGIFVSVFYAILDTGTWDMTYANGGHLPPYLIKDGAGEKAALIHSLGGGAGTVLGIQDDLEYGESTVNIDRGDALFFYTDGLTEAFDVDRKQFSDARLMDCLLDNKDRSAHALADRVFAFVNHFTGGAPQSDDMTSLVVKRFK
jgi:sigma-B regulation protein RsbU (phosphoserine phosphatase)